MNKAVEQEVLTVCDNCGKMFPIRSKINYVQYKDNEAVRAVTFNCNKCGAMYISEFITKSMQLKIQRIKKFDRLIRNERVDEKRNNLIDKRRLMLDNMKAEHDALKAKVATIVEKQLNEAKSHDKTKS